MHNKGKQSSKLPLEIYIVNHGPANPIHMLILMYQSPSDLGGKVVTASTRVVRSFFPASIIEA